MAKMREAFYYAAGPGDQVKCLLCPRECRLAPDQAGVCRVRENRAGRLYTRNYGRTAACALDPVEKKPLYHFCPGSTILSLGTVGCNFGCRFCQNWSIAQAEPSTIEFSPEQAVLAVREAAAPYRCIGLAFTYSEPLVWYEYVQETAEQVRRAGFKNVLVTNGFIQEQPLKELLPFIDALNIDVKAFTNEFYRRWCKGSLEPVLRTVETAVAQCHVELTNLLIPGLNDSAAEISALVAWVAGLSRNIPLHFSRYFPNYQLDLPATAAATLEKAYALAREQLNYVYLGNLPGSQRSDTTCPRCAQLLIERNGYQTKVIGLSGQECANCGELIPLVSP